MVLASPAAGRRGNQPIWPILFGLGASGLFLIAADALAAPAMTAAMPAPVHLGSVPMAFKVDGLAAWFWLVVALVGLAIAPYLRPYMDHVTADMRIFWAALGVLMLSMAGVIGAANVQTFLVFWEAMSLSSFVLVVTNHIPQSTRRAGLVYLGATRAGTALLAGGFLWAFSLAGSWTFEDWHLTGHAALGPGLLILVGLAVKAGMWPFHLWLPAAHPAAPSPVSALMSGVMVKVAVFAMVRFFLIPGPLSNETFGHVLLAFGGISAFWGVLFALLQRGIKRLLAYSTVENVGLILMGVGLAIVARRPLPDVAALALAAALFHVLNHAIFKSLLFLSAGAVDHSTGTRLLDRLGGLGRRMPVTFVAFLAGSAAICALPPLNGFASEWLLYQAFIGVGGSGVVPLHRFLALGTVGWISLIGALALACFLKACGVVFLGRPRTHATERAVEVPWGMRVAQVGLACACAVLGLSAPAVLGFLDAIIPFGSGVSRAWTLPMGALVLVLALTVAALATWLRSSPVRTYITWECGFGDLTPRMQVSALSFSQPVARLFGVLYRYALNLRLGGADPRHFPQDITVKPQTRSLLESHVYGPLLLLIDRLGAAIVRLQAGSIHLYLLTMFVTLCALVILGRYLP